MGISYAPYIKERLVQSGDAGVSPADLFIELKAGVNGYQTNATYNSFMRYFHWYKQLGYVRKVATEPSSQRGGDYGVLTAPRTLYVITQEGLEADVLTQWTNPLTTLHPEWSYLGHKRQAYLAEYVSKRRTTRKRGRPRKTMS